MAGTVQVLVGDFLLEVLMSPNFEHCIRWIGNDLEFQFFDEKVVIAEFRARKERGEKATLITEDPKERWKNCSVEINQDLVKNFNKGIKFASKKSNQKVEPENYNTALLQIQKTGPVRCYKFTDLQHICGKSGITEEDLTKYIQGVVQRNQCTEGSKNSVCRKRKAAQTPDEHSIANEKCFPENELEVAVFRANENSTANVQCEEVKQRCLLDLEHTIQESSFISEGTRSTEISKFKHHDETAANEINKKRKLAEDSVEHIENKENKDCIEIVHANTLEGIVENSKPIKTMDDYFMIACYVLITRYSGYTGNFLDFGDFNVPSNHAATYRLQLAAIVLLLKSGQLKGVNINIPLFIPPYTIIPLFLMGTL